MVKLFLSEELTKLRIIDRTNAEAAGLTVLRLITGIGTFAVMACGWAGVGFICYYESTFYKLIPVPFLNTFAPMALVPCVSLVIKPVLKVIVYMERWDFEHQKQRQVLIRTYLAGLLNNVAFALIYSEVLLQKQFVLLGYVGYVESMSVANSPKIRFPSKEDMIATQYLKIVRTF